MNQELREAQVFLVEELRGIWFRESNKIVVAILLALSLLSGVVVGILQGTRATLRQTAYVTAQLQEEVALNRTHIERLTRQNALDQQRYHTLLMAFESLKRKAVLKPP